MTELVQSSLPNINIQAKAIYKERELMAGANIKCHSIVRPEATVGGTA